MKVEESLNVTFDKTPPPPKISPLKDDDLVEEQAIEVSKTRPLGNDLKDKYLENNEIITIKESKSHQLENVIVPNPKDTTRIGTKWVFRNKLDENGVVSRNKARLVAQGNNQQEGIDYDEIYAPVARLESIRILLAYACALDFKLFQMDVKSAFLNSFINEEVYMEQPSRFIDFIKPNHVYRLKKALYGLKQALKAWYNRLKAFLIKHDYTIGMVDNTLFTKKKDSNLIIVQIYVDDIIFGSTCQEMCDDFAKIMHDEFEMKMLKKFRLEDSKPMKTPISTETKLTKDVEGTMHLGLWYSKESGIETIVYADSDHAGDYVDRKSTSGICTFMGCCLTSWFSKKQTALAISTTEAEYIGFLSSDERGRGFEEKEKQGMATINNRVMKVSGSYEASTVGKNTVVYVNEARQETMNADAFGNGNVRVNVDATSTPNLVSGEPSRKNVNFCTLLAPTDNGADVVIFLESNTWSKYGLVKSMMNSANGLFFFKFRSKDGMDAMLENGPWSRYVRAMIELRADVELKDTIVVVVPKLVGEEFSMRVQVGLKLGFKPTKQVYQPVFKKNGANVSGKRSKLDCLDKEVSNSNLFDALNLVKKDDDLGTNEGGDSKLAEKGANFGVVSSTHGTSSKAFGSLTGTPVAEKFNNFERQMLDGKPLKRLIL
ncbi:retrovirus-related pol polyprotein from transposon TNT 1-94 [Tanacetum coccineum]|uniref:Retrovirus-related pol polyprotein from transposon TNT 1-94 n=1 Tax=Tanacetum coccineum TaxID=301880 RepID=A0ABQ4WE43_9ASTR